MTISAAQIRAGRGLLNWTAKDLATKIGITPSSLSAIENGQSKGSVQTLAALEATLMAGGVDLLPSDGVAMRQVHILELRGSEGFKTLMTDVYETAKSIGGDICLHNAKPSHWIKWLGEGWYSVHKERMEQIKGNFTLRITVAEGDTKLIASPFAEYRSIPITMFNDRGFYCYGSKIAFLNFKEDDIQVFILDQQEFSDGFRGMFNITWHNIAQKLSIGAV